MPKRSNALEVLRKDHRDMQALFHRYAQGAGKRQDEELVRNMVRMLKLHTELEEEVFYPYIRDATDALELVEEANVEHFAAKDLATELESGNPDPVHRHAVAKVLSEYLGHHIREEEERIFPLVEKTGIDLEALGEELLERRQALESAKPPRQAESAPSAAWSQEDDRTFLEKHRKGLSRSTLQAKWISSPGEHEDHPGQTLATRNPEVIRRWAEERKAKPATIPGDDPGNPRVLRLDFPGYSEDLVQLSWDAWFSTFRRRDLVFLFQEHLKNGRPSNFFQFDNPEQAG
jgi:hemerythrin superfamily protein